MNLSEQLDDKIRFFFKIESIKRKKGFRPEHELLARQIQRIVTDDASKLLELIEERK